MIPTFMAGIPTPELIKREASLFFGLTRAEMEGPNRARKFSRPRMIAMTLCRMYGRSSLPEIGRRFGGRDHTTVMSAIRSIDGLVAGKPELQQPISTLCAIIESQLLARRAQILNRIPQPAPKPKPQPILLLPAPKPKEAPSIKRPPPSWYSARPRRVMVA